MRILESYGIIYPPAFLIALALTLWLHWPALLHKEGPVFLLAAILGVAAGGALTFAILVEIGGRTVLLIPKAVKEIMEKGREQGREEGLELGQKQRDQRYQEALDKFGVEVDGVRMLPDTPEIREFLQSPPGE